MWTRRRTLTGLLGSWSDKESKKYGGRMSTCVECVCHTNA